VLISVLYCSVYRSLFDRVTSLRLPLKRVKFLLDRYIAFETTHGTEDAVQAVRQKALDWAKSSELELTD